MGIIREFAERIRSRHFGAMGQYNLVKPVLADGESCILELDVNGNLLVAPGAGIWWIVVGPGLQDDAIDDAHWPPVEISLESEAYATGVAFNVNVPVSQDGDVVRPKGSWYGVQYNMLVSQDGSLSAQIQEDVVYVAGTAYGVPPMVVRRDTPAAVAIDGSWTPLESDALGALWVHSVPTSVPYYAEDTEMHTGDLGDFILAVRNDNASNDFTSDNGDFSAIAVTEQGVLFSRPDPYIAYEMYANAYQGALGDEPPFFATGPGYDIRVTGTVTVAQSPATACRVPTHQSSTVMVQLACASWGTCIVAFFGGNPDGTTSNIAAFNAVDGGRAMFTQVYSDGIWIIPCAGYQFVEVYVADGNLADMVVNAECSMQHTSLVGMSGKYHQDFPSVAEDIGNSVVTLRQDYPIEDTSDDGDYQPLKSDVRGRLWVTLGTGTGGSAFAEDSPHANGDVGIECLARRNDAATNSATSDGDYCTLNEDADGYLRVVDRSYDAPTNALRELPVTDLSAHRTAGDAPVYIIAASTELVGPALTWTDLGGEIPTMGYTRMTLWFNLDINDSTGIMFRMLCRHTSGGGDYTVPLFRPTTTGVAGTWTVDFEPERFLAFGDVDQKSFITWDISNTIPYVRFQASETVDGGGGASNAHILDACVTYGWAS